MSSSSGNDVPPTSGTGIQKALPRVPIAPPPIPRINPRPENLDLNLRPTGSEDNAYVHHYGHNFLIPTPPQYFTQNYGANYSTRFSGFGYSNVGNWLQTNYQLPNYHHLATPGTPRPARPSLHGSNHLPHQQNLSGHIPIWFEPRPRAAQFPVTNPVNIYRPRAPDQEVSTEFTLDIGYGGGSVSNPNPNIPTGEYPRTDLSVPLETSLSSSKAKPDQQGLVPKDKEKKTKEQARADEHVCYPCKKVFDSGKALGGHMSSHERKRKRDQDLGLSLAISAPTSPQSTPPTSCPCGDLIAKERAEEPDASSDA